jgi:hypothetical protein
MNHNWIYNAVKKIPVFKFNFDLIVTSDAVFKNGFNLLFMCCRICFEDGQSFPAHKCILASASRFFASQIGYGDSNLLYVNSKYLSYHDITLVSYASV